MVCAKGSWRGREGCDDIWELSALSAAGWTAGASPSHTAQDESTCNPVPFSSRKGHNPTALFHPSRGWWGCPGCIPRSCGEQRAQPVPGQHLAALQPHPQHFLFPSLEFLTFLQAQPLLSFSHQLDKLHGDITVGQTLPAECR